MNKCVAGCDAVVNTAAALPLYSPEDIRTTEVDGARNVIAACRRSGVPRMIQISSTAVYGVPKKHPIYEDDELVGGAAPGGGRYATVGGADAVFVISRRTAADFTAPLAE